MRRFTLQPAWRRVGATWAVAIIAFAVIFYRTSATSLAAIIFLPMVAMCLAALLVCHRPLLVTAHLVAVSLLNGLSVSAVIGDPIDPFAYLGVCFFQWLGGGAGAAVVLISLLSALNERKLRGTPKVRAVPVSDLPLAEEVE